MLAILRSKWIYACFYQSFAHSPTLGDWCALIYLQRYSGEYVADVDYGKITHRHQLGTPWEFYARFFSTGILRKSVGLCKGSDEDEDSSVIDCESSKGVQNKGVHANLLTQVVVLPMGWLLHFGPKCCECGWGLLRGAQELFETQIWDKEIQEHQPRFILFAQCYVATNSISLSLNPLLLQQDKLHESKKLVGFFPTIKRLGEGIDSISREWAHRRRVS